MKQDSRKTVAQKGYGSRWTEYSKRFRHNNPLCAECLKMGRLTSVEHGGHVDHIKAVSGPNDPLFWDTANHVSLCRPCHSRKTAQEDGAFGNKGNVKVSSACGSDGLPVDGRHHWNYPGGG